MCKQVAEYEMNKLNEIQKDLSQLMEGLNFATEFEVIDLGYSYSNKELWTNYKKIFPNEKDYESKLVDGEIEEFWLKLNFAFSYRGDGYSGFQVSGEIENRLNELQFQYKTELRTLFATSRMFKYCPNFDGLNYYPVFWGFHVLFESQNNWFMVIGSASD